MAQFDKKYVFILGRLAALSLAEIRSLLLADEKIIASGDIALVSLSQPLADPQKTLDSLGGTIKIGQIFASISLPTKNLTDEASQKIANRILEKFSSHSSKINYGISAYNLPMRHENFLKNLLKNVKHRLAEAKKSSRFVNKNFENVRSVVDSDIDFLVMGTGAEIYLAETVAVQNFKSYELRDYAKPCRDMESGMLPPKIAQIMINLSGLRKFSKESTAPAANSAPFTIYDPFCGSGTILTEALLMGLNAIGSDISAKAISDSEKNIKWIMEKYRLTGTLADVFQKNINSLTQKDLHEKIDAIVAECYLGPRITRPLHTDALRRTNTELSTLYEVALKKFKELKLACPVVLAIAAFKNRDKYYFIENFPATAKKLGFKIAALSNLPRGSLIYNRPDQFVAREIFLLN
ncbi:hypothetical protein HZA39_04340 [Candidatus Peregrinibacteria bacterium]|nr:hypothetical protein [Candidatus Peregrinibacteria bacterium]